MNNGAPVAADRRARGAAARWQNVSPDGPRTVIIDWESASTGADFFRTKNRRRSPGRDRYFAGGSGHIRLRKVVKKGDAPAGPVEGYPLAEDSSQKPVAVEVNCRCSSRRRPDFRRSRLVVELLVGFLAGLILK